MLFAFHRVASASASTRRHLIVGRRPSLVIAFINKNPTTKVTLREKRLAYSSASTPATVAASSSRPQLLSLAAAASNRNSNHDNHNGNDNTNTSRRPVPPSLSSYNHDDDGVFGGFSSEADEYDLQHMDHQELWDYNEDDFVPPDEGDEWTTTAPSSSSSSSSSSSAASTKKESSPKNQPVSISNHQEQQDGQQQQQQQQQQLTDLTAAPKPQEKKNIESPTPSSPASAEETKYQRDAEFFKRASTGMGVTSELDRMEQELEKVKLDLFAATNNPKFNPKSPRQVAEALYGTTGESTNKEVLEAMAASGNKIANFMLQFRHLSREISKFKKRKENKANGTYVKSVYTVKRAIRWRSGDSMNDEDVSTTAGDTAAENLTTSTMHAKVEAAKVRPQPTIRVEPDDPLLLIDASAYIFRAYYAYPPLHRSDGLPIGAVLGFCNMLNRLVLNTMMKGERPRIVLVFDAPGKTFRHGIYELYKANRAEAPVDLIPQFPLIREVGKVYGIAQIEAASYEADDVIATLASMALEEGLDTNILSGDKDLMQLVTPSDERPCVQIIDPVSMARVSFQEVVAKFGVPPKKLGDVLALAGDSSDNVPGVPGIGPKIAANLIESFGSLENLLENIENVKQKARREKLQSNVEQARLSRVLVELERRVPLDKMTFPDGVEKVADLRMSPMDPDRLVQFFDEMGLRDLKRRFENRLQQQRGVKGNPKRSAERSKFVPRSKTEVPQPQDFRDVPF